MNKRNTEGYVLAYLLIVIAVMGAIAATLMTSTVQVMASQQNSIQYMKDKYEAMGEVEKLVAELVETFEETQPSDGIATFREADFDFYNDAINAAKNKITSLVPTLAEAENLVFSRTSSSSTLDIYDGEYSFSFTIEQDAAFITAKYQLPLTIKIITQKYDPYKDTTTGDMIYPPDEFEYQISIHSLNVLSYDITSNGGAT